MRFVGLDVHKESIAVGIAEQDGSVRSMGVIPNRLEAIRKLVKKLGGPREITVCYEAGPTGYVLYWQLQKIGVNCVVIAPSLVPTRPGDRVKTDRRDAMKLARSYRAGDLTPVWVPRPEHEALRDLVRAREAAKKDQRRARQRLLKFLLRRGVNTPEKMRPWTERHRQWVYGIEFEHAPQQVTLLDLAGEVDHAKARIERLDKAIDEAIASAPETMRKVVEALQALRGVSKVTAVTVVSEVGQFSRFERASQLMGYSGAVPSEYSSGERTKRGAITKAGNAHLRRVLGESAWAYRFRPRVVGRLRKRQEGLSESVTDIAWKAQERLHKRYVRLLGAGKEKHKVITAVTRELLGFIWAIGVDVERKAA
jgi:transposase